MCVYILLSSEPLSCLTLADLISWFTSFSFSPAHKRPRNCKKLAKTHWHIWFTGNYTNG